MYDGMTWASIDPDPGDVEHVEVKELADGSAAIVEKKTQEPLQTVTSARIAKALLGQWQIFFVQAIRKARLPRV